MKNADMPAMPQPIATDLEGGIHSSYDKAMFEGGPDAGLTKREQFAMAAMQGLCMQSGYNGPNYVAKDAVRCADALLAELEPTQ